MPFTTIGNERKLSYLLLACKNKHLGQSPLVRQLSKILKAKIVTCNVSLLLGMKENSYTHYKHAKTSCKSMSIGSAVVQKILKEKQEMEEKFF